MAVKQVIVWRHDLKCRMGKKMAQSGHAALSHLSALIVDHVDADGNVSFQMTPAQFEWYLTNFRKIVCKVDSEADLMLLYLRCKEMQIPVELVIDDGLTEWNEPTKTCIAIGPEKDEIIDQVTGENGPLGRLSLL